MSTFVLRPFSPPFVGTYGPTSVSRITRSKIPALCNLSSPLTCGLLEVTAEVDTGLDYRQLALQHAEPTSAVVRTMLREALAAFDLGIHLANDKVSRECDRDMYAGAVVYVVGAILRSKRADPVTGPACCLREHVSSDLSEEVPRIGLQAIQARGACHGPCCIWKAF